jgi:hypothetical protein
MLGRTQTPRRFPPPWTVEEATESFCIRDANGQVLAYVYFEEFNKKGRPKAPLVVAGWDRYTTGAASGKATMAPLVLHRYDERSR